MNYQVKNGKLSWVEICCGEMADAMTTYDAFYWSETGGIHLAFRESFTLEVKFCPFCGHETIEEEIDDK